MKSRLLVAASLGAVAFPVAGVALDLPALDLARLSIFGAALGGAVAVDLAERRIPNRLVLPAAAACAGLSIANGVPFQDLAAGVAVVALLLAFALWRAESFGMGDVKLALLVVLGLNGKRRSRHRLRACSCRSARGADAHLQRTGCGEASAAARSVHRRRLSPRARGMSTYPEQEIRSRAGAVLVVVASLGALAFLWVFRPTLKGLPRSLAEPLTATALEDLGLLLAWLGLAGLVLLLLGRALRSTANPRPRAIGGHNGLGSRPVRPKRRSTQEASAPRSSAFHEQVVLTVGAPAETRAALKREPRAEPAQQAPPIEVSVLGPLQINGGKRRRRLRGSAQQLIAYLALHPGGANRDQLLEALWPGHDPKRSEQRLWQSTSDVRRVLGEVISRDRDRYSLDRSLVRVDVDELERFVGEANGAGGHGKHELLEKALALYRGEPLAGSDFSCCEGEIRHLRGTYVELLDHVGRARLEAGDGRGALHAAEGGLAVDLLNESLWRLAMEAESALGLRESLSERYETLSQILNERLGLQPDRETRSLHRRLLSQA